MGLPTLSNLWKNSQLRHKCACTSQERASRLQTLAWRPHPGIIPSYLATAGSKMNPLVLGNMYQAWQLTVDSTFQRNASSVHAWLAARLEVWGRFRNSKLMVVPFIVSRASTVIVTFLIEFILVVFFMMFLEGSHSEASSAARCEIQKRSSQMWSKRWNFDAYRYTFSRLPNYCLVRFFSSTMLSEILLVPFRTSDSIFSKPKGSQHVQVNCMDLCPLQACTIAHEPFIKCLLECDYHVHGTTLLAIKHTSHSGLCKELI